LLVRHGAAVVDVAIVDWTDDAPPTSEVVALAEALAARLDDARSGRSPDLTDRIARLGGPGVELRWDGYLRRAGIQQPVYRQPASAVETIDESAREAGILDRYEYRARWRNPEREAAEPVAFAVDVMRFGSPATATTFVADVRQERASAIVDGAGSFGDESVIAGFSREGTDGRSHPGYAAWIRVGELVALVEVVGPGIDLPTLTAILERQAGCLRGADCRDPVLSDGFPDEAAPMRGPAGVGAQRL